MIETETATEPAIPRDAEAHAALAALAVRAAALQSQWRPAANDGAIQLKHHLTDAHRKHETHLQILEDEVADASDARATVRRYRAAVSTDILSGLRTAIGDGIIYRSAREHLATVMEQLSALEEDLPPLAIMDDPDEAYRSAPSDSLAIRTRKRMTRVGRRIGGVWSSMASSVRRSQNGLPFGMTREVELRPLFREEVAAPLAKRWLDEAQSIEQGLGAVIASCVDLASAWSADMLAAERANEREVWNPEDDAADSAGIDLARAAARQLHEGLAVLADEVPMRKSIEVSAEELFAQAENAVADAGTYRYRARRQPKLDDHIRRQSTDVDAAKRWLRAASGSLELDSLLIQLYEDLSEIVRDSAVKAASAGFRQVAGTIGDLQEALQRAVAHVEIAPADNLADIIGAQGMEVRDLFRQTFGSGPPLDDALLAIGKQQDERLAALAARLPASMTVRASRANAAFDFQEPVREVHIRRVAEETLSSPLATRVAAAGEALRRSIARAWTDAAQAEQIVDYNRMAALEEVRSQDADAASRARMVFVEGVQRAHERLEDARDRMEQPFRLFSAAFFRAIDDDWGDLYTRVDSDTRLERGLADVRARYRRSLRHTVQLSTETLAARSADVRKTVRLLRRSTRSVVRRGQSAIGVSIAVAEERQRTVDVLAGAAAARAELPIIYRRLFAAEPLAEAPFLVGRRNEMEFVQKHIARWRDGRPSTPLAITASVGNGRTSFLNVLQAALASDVLRIDFRERLADEAALAHVLSRGLDLDSCDTLREVGEALQELRGDERTICFIDGLERAILRVPGGRGLIERLLRMFSATDAHVCWVITCTTQAWRYVERTSASATSLATQVPLAPLDSSGIADAILVRHRRSGIALSFAEPLDLSPLARQRLKQARTEEERQTILSADYFERLYRHSGRNMSLAFHYWLRSTDFAAEGGALLIRPLVPLSWAFLTELELGWSFSLHALMMHGELTPEEHATVLRISDEQSILILEHLLNLHLIEPASPQREAGPVREGVSYRLNPLALHPISEHLRARRILY